MSKETKTGETTSTPAAKETVVASPAATDATKNPTPPAENKNQADGKGEALPASTSVVEPGTSVVPEKYDLKPKKDSLLQSGDVEEVAAQAKALGLSQEQAQKMVESRESNAEQFQQRQQEAYRSQQAEWRKTAEADKEIAGSDGKAFKENVELAHRALERFADPAFKKTLNETGLGNHPELIRTFVRIGKGMANDKAVLDVKTAAPSKKLSREEKLYPTHKKE